MHKIRVHLIQLFCLKKTKGFANGAHVLRFGKVFNLLTDNHPPNFLLTYLILLQKIQKGIIFQAKGGKEIHFFNSLVNVKILSFLFAVRRIRMHYHMVLDPGSGLFFIQIQIQENDYNLNFCP